MRFLKFLVWHDKTYRGILCKAIPTVGAIFLAIWKFDFAQLTTQGIIQPALKREIRIILSEILSILILLSFLFLHRFYLKKYKNTHTLSNEEIENITKYL